MRKRQTATLAAWGMASQRRMRLVGFKPVTKGALRGFASVELSNGLIVMDCPVLVGPNGAWGTLPSKPALDSEGKHLQPNGKPLYTTVLRWSDRDLARLFSDPLVALVQAACPDALAEAGPAQTSMDI